jgi:hypothetical protein
MGRKGTEGRFFVLPHEAAKAVHISAEYGGELTLQYPPLTASAGDHPATVLTLSIGAFLGYGADPLLSVTLTIRRGGL